MFSIPFTTEIRNITKYEKSKTTTHIEITQLEDGTQIIKWNTVEIPKIK